MSEIRGGLFRWSWLDHLLKDIRYAVRGLVRAPGFTGTVVVTLGLGIGANAAMFGVVDRLMFRPFPFLVDPSRVQRVYLQFTARGATLTRSIMPYTRYRDLVEATHSFSAAAAVAEQSLAVGTGLAARERIVTGVSASFFGFFSISPAVGRFFGPGEDVTPLGAPVAVLGHGYWQSELGGKPVVGQTIRIGTADHTIIGVAPEGFVGIAEGEPPAVIIPITSFPLAAGENKVSDYYTRYNWDWTTLIVRRKPGVSEQAASADLSDAYSRSRTLQRSVNPAVLPDSVAHPKGIAGALRTAAGPDAGLESRTLLWVAGVAAIVLLIACANVTNLMVARVLGRRREIAVRLALGVSRRRLVGQLFTETILLAALGGLVGVAVAQWGGLALRRLVLPAGSSLTVVSDWRSLAAAAVFALVAAVVTAIVPGLAASTGNLAESFRTAGRAGAGSRSVARSALLVLQAALSVVLLVGAHLFVRSVDQVRSIRLGYDPAPVLMVSSELRGLHLDSTATVLLRRRLLTTARAIPGVAAVSRVNSRPFGTNTAFLSVPGVDSVERLGRFNFQVADPEYFAVMGTRIVLGRSSTAADREHAPQVVVVSESMARALWPGQNPIGRCLVARFDAGPGASAEQACRTVVGVAEDAINQSMTDDQRFMYYLPVDQVNPSWGSQLFLRVDGDLAPAAERVRVALDAVMPGEGYVTVHRLDELIERQRRSWQLGATMFVAFGVLALLVAAVGLYGVVSYDVAQRIREVGIRIALGARVGHVVRLVVGQGFRIAATGVVIGTALALGLAGWIQPLLFHQSARDPATYGLIATVLVVVAVLASALPAARAARVDPNRVLKSD